MTDVLNRFGATVTRSPGLHVHLDAPEFYASPAQEAQEENDLCSGNRDGVSAARQVRQTRFVRLKTLMLFYLVFDDVIRAMLPRSRRINTYCRQLSGAFHLTELMDTNSVGDIEKLWYRTGDAEHIQSEKRMKGSATRYHGVNLHSLLHAGHLEVRYHSGTTSAAKILHWTALHQAILDTASRVTTNVCGFWDGLQQVRADVSIAAKFSHLANRISLTPATRAYLLSRIRLFWNSTEEEEK
jgi:hypothetical protein